MLTKLQAWMRARGDAAGSTFTADTIADKYGVVKGSYTSIALPNSKSYQVSWSLTLSHLHQQTWVQTWCNASQQQQQRNITKVTHG